MAGLSNLVEHGGAADDPTLGDFADDGLTIGDFADDDLTIGERPASDATPRRSTSYQIGDGTPTMADGVYDDLAVTDSTLGDGRRDPTVDAIVGDPLPVATAIGWVDPNTGVAPDVTMADATRPDTTPSEVPGDENRPFRSGDRHRPSEDEDDTLTDMERPRPAPPASAARPRIASLWLDGAARERRIVPPPTPVRVPVPPPTPVRATLRGADPAALPGVSASRPNSAWSTPATPPRPVDAAPDNTPWSLSSPGMPRPAPLPPAVTDTDGPIPIHRSMLGTLVHLVLGETIDGGPDRLPPSLSFAAALGLTLVVYAALWNDSKPEVLVIELPQPEDIAHIWVPQPEEPKPAEAPLKEEPDEPPEDPPKQQRIVRAQPEPVTAPPEADPVPEPPVEPVPDPPNEASRAQPKKPRPTRQQNQTADAYAQRAARPGVSNLFERQLGSPPDEIPQGTPPPSGDPAAGARALAEGNRPAEPSLGPEIERLKEAKQVKRRVDLGRVGAPRLEGGSPDEKKRIEEAIDRKWHALSRCLVKARHTDRDLVGKLTMRFEIKPDGHARRITGKVEPTDSPVLIACVANEIATIRIERDTPGLIGVRYVFTLGG